ncbi:hypothetical protein CLU79DRAFT_423492 [Phycomyces nitens]|nr:hypothetical protein CLU79DRAFT_423492 [Phycomyces nitens]
MIERIIELIDSNIFFVLTPFSFIFIYLYIYICHIHTHTYIYITKHYKPTSGCLYILSFSFSFFFACIFN